MSPKNQQLSWCVLSYCKILSAPNVAGQSSNQWSTDDLLPKINCETEESEDMIGMYNPPSGSVPYHPSSTTNRTDNDPMRKRMRRSNVETPERPFSGGDSQTYSALFQGCAPIGNGESKVPIKI